MEDTHGADTLCYHGNTMLQDGRQGLLVDPGAWSNLAGEVWIQEMAKKALAAGHDVAHPVSQLWKRFHRIWKNQGKFHTLEISLRIH